MPSSSNSERAQIAELEQDISHLRGELESVREQNSRAIGLVDTMRQRVEALEKRFSAMESRMTHIDTMLMELQGEVKRMRNSIETLARDQSAALNDLRSMMERVLGLLQPQVTIGPPVAGG